MGSRRDVHSTGTPLGKTGIQRSAQWEMQTVSESGIAISRDRAVQGWTLLSIVYIKHGGVKFEIDTVVKIHAVAP
jgi:hypothetical protein